MKRVITTKSPCGTIELSKCSKQKIYGTQTSMDRFKLSGVADLYVWIPMTITEIDLCKPCSLQGAIKSVMDIDCIVYEFENLREFGLWLAGE